MKRRLGNAAAIGQAQEPDTAVIQATEDGMLADGTALPAFAQSSSRARPGRDRWLEAAKCQVLEQRLQKFEFSVVGVGLSQTSYRKGRRYAYRQGLST